MFLALRDIVAARGRFFVVTVTVAMMALLVTFLSALTGGLGHQSTSVLGAVGGEVAYLQDTGANPSFDQSRISPATVDELMDSVPATAVSASMSRVGTTPVAVVAGRAAGKGPASASLRLPAPGHAIVSVAAAQRAGVHVGEVISVGGKDLRVDEITGDVWLNHAPVVLTHLSADQPATVVVTSAPVASPPAGLTSVPVKKLPGTVAAHAAESSSLLMINVMLLVIVALVTAAFFIVWTVQRTNDIATLKALGATAMSLAVDVIGQAAMVLGAGIAIGVGVSFGLAAAVGGALPLMLGAAQTVLPAVVMFVLGVLGAAVSLVFVRQTSALVALRSR